ncbi:hypothetical protein LCGC14_1777590 [marine sediment metagenome]|uniref:DUF7352 domain-containing protein n=1 Tax=marine sediment metagenome TaxID=412755 RepID=A0A0F9JW19_9ZZZZ
MKTIWKFVIEIDDTIEVMMPQDAKILTVQIQHEMATIWAMVDTCKSDVKRILRIVGTGHEISPKIIGDYIGTFQIDSGNLVFHVFDIGELCKQS